MGYTREYYKLFTVEDAPRQAVKELVEWLGYRRARFIVKLAKDKENVSWRTFNVACGFAGASGFPVTSAWRRWRGEEPVWEDEE